MHLGPMIEGNDTLLKHVASEREKETLLMVAPTARMAIKQEILPQLEEGVSKPGDVDELADQAKAAIEAGFQAKSPVYTRLINYKSIDQSDTQYLTDLLHVMDEWARKTKATLEGDGNSKKEEAPPEITVKVEVENGLNVQTDSSDPNVEVQVVKEEPKEEPKEAPQEAAVSIEMPYSDTSGDSAANEEDVPVNAPAMLLFDLKDLRL